MGKATPPPDVKYFTGVLTSRPDLAAQIEERLAKRFGEVDLRSDSFPFDSTRYYETEMGRRITRYFLGFSELRSPELLAEAKLATNELESAFAQAESGVRRSVNFDPGYIEQSKIVLASTKNFYHRILLAGGIYAEVTMHFESGAWQPLPWTFPDFRSGRYNPFFTRLREIYRSQLRNRCRMI